MDFQDFDIIKISKIPKFRIFRFSDLTFRIADWDHGGHFDCTKLVRLVRNRHIVAANELDVYLHLYLHLPSHI